jgi:hypothetical protein
LQSDSSQYSQIGPEEIHDITKSSWLSLRRKRNRTIWMGALGSYLLALWIIVLLESWLWMPPLAKISLLIAALALFGFVFYAISNHLKNVHFKSFYSTFSNDKSQNSVRYVLDLMQNEETFKPGLHEAALQQNLAKIDVNRLKSDLSEFNQKSDVSETASSVNLVFGSGVVLVALFAFFSQDSFSRLLAPFDSFYPPNPFTYSISPADTTIEQGTRLRIEAKFEDTPPREVVLAFKTDQESDFRLERMDRIDGDIFRSGANEAFSDISYYILMDGFRTQTYRANVQLLPRFSELVVQIEPPSYTKLESTQHNYPFGQIEAYPGSRVKIDAKANQPLQQVMKISGVTSDSVALGTSDNQVFSYEYELTQRDSLWFTMNDENGLKNRNTFSFTIETQVDDHPEVRFLRPDANLSKLDPENLNLVYELSDDFGISQVRLHYSLQRSFGSKPPETGNISLRTPNERIAVEDYTWNLETLRLLPMDVLTYWLVVFDNDEVSGFKQARSANQTLTVASLTDFLMAQEEREQDIGTQFEEFQDEYEQTMREFEELRQEIINNPQERWEQSQAAQELREKREELSKKLDEIKDQFDELSNELNESNQLSEDTRKMYEDLTKLIDEIDDPEVMKALEMLQKGLENMDQNSIRDALQKIEFDEARYKERLERTIELFKALQTNAELDRLSAILEDLASQEESLIGEDIPSTEEQLDMQEHIRKQMEKLKDRVEQLPDKSPNRGRDAMEHLKNESLQDMSNIDSMLQEDIGEMQEGGSDGSDDGSQERREQIRNQMSQMQQNMQKSKAAMGQESIQVNRQALLSIMQNMLLLSDAQEDVVKGTSELVQGSAGFIDVARRQRALSRSFELITDSLYQVAAEVPSFPNRLMTRKAEVQRNLERAVGYLAERDRNRSVSEERVALGGMNEISTMLADLLEALDNSGGGGGGGGGMSSEQMMEQLQNMSGDQQQLNQQIQDMINDMAGERMVQDQMDRLDQMARQQNEIRRQMREIQRSGGFESGDQILSELERIVQEMEDAINDLRGGVTERVIVQRQQNILSRMLEAERALNERDLDEERRGDRPSDVERVSPAELTLEALREQIRRTLQDPNETRYSDEYQRLIQRYFELLEEAQRRGQ